MDALQFSASPWAIQPEKLIEIQALIRSNKIDMKAGQVSAVSRPGGAQIVGNVAVLEISGILLKRPGIIAQFFGATSTAALAEQFNIAVNSPEVSAIVLVIDSPGGTVDGTQALASQILAARGKKPIVAVADGCMCSAAYWIGASADHVYASSNVSQIGSIGVVAAHTDISAKQAAEGVKTTEIAAGKYKRIASNYAPLTAEGRETIQSTVDYLYSLFVGHVARARNTSEARVLSAMADGRVFIGDQATQVGLIDGIKSIDECIKGAAKMQKAIGNRADNSASIEQLLHQEAKAYQERHPGTDFLVALRIVSKKHSVGSSVANRSSGRSELHEKAKAYQALHPGTEYIDAIKAVAS